MDLHYQAIVQAHARHFGEHLRAEEFPFVAISAPCYHSTEQRLGLGCRYIRGAGGWMSMIGCGATKFAKAFPTPLECTQIALPGRSVFPCAFPQSSNVLA